VDALIGNFQGWTSKPLAPAGFLNGDSLNFNFAKGHIWADRGFKIHTQVAAASDTNKAGASFLFRHTDGGEHVLYVCDDGVYRHDGTDITATGWSAKFCPTFAAMSSPCGHGVLLNGVDGEAQLIQEVSTNELAVLFNSLVAPSIATSFATSGGSIADGTYQCRVCWLDDGGAVVVYGAPSAADAIVVSGGGGNATITVNEPASAPDRATKFRVAFTAAGVADSPANFLYHQDFAKAAGNQVFTSLPTVSTDQAFVDINGTYRQATMPISNVDIGCVHDGRFWIMSTTSNEAAWSERDNMNHWYSDQVISSGAETAWNGPGVGMVSTAAGLFILTADSIHIVEGTMRRDDQGTNATYAIDVRSRVIDSGLGGVNHASIASAGGSVYFWSTRGPARLTPSGAVLLNTDDTEHFIGKYLDPTYLERICAAEDPNLNAMCWLVPRRTNSDREMDGAATAGICDRVLRYDMEHGSFFAPLSLEATHLIRRKNPATKGTITEETFLMAMGPHYGSALRLNYGWSGGGPADVSGASYDGLLASAEDTTSVTVALAGISADALIGQTLLITWPSADTGFPDCWALRTISDNTATAAGNVTITWIGALDAGTSTKRTVYLAGWPHVADLRADMAALVQVGADQSVQLQAAELRLMDVVGAESAA
jgi:hypothetical protein